MSGWRKISGQGESVWVRARDFEPPEQVRRTNIRKAQQARNRKRRARSPELAEDGVEALDDFMRSNRFNAIQGND